MDKKQFKPPAWECRDSKANRLCNDIKEGKKVSRWEVYPLRRRMLQIAEKDENLKDKLNILITEAEASI
jgi:hypothetical protein